jgi:hypothetical protein
MSETPEYDATLHRFHVCFLDAPITVSVGKTMMDAIGKAHPSFVDDRDKDTKGMTLLGEDEPWCIICLPEDTSINTVVHECVHAVHYLIQHYELPNKLDDDELMAYMMGYFVDCVYDAMEAHEKIKEETKIVEKPKKPKKGKKV